MCIMISGPMYDTNTGEIYSMVSSGMTGLTTVTYRQTLKVVQAGLSQEELKNVYTELGLSRGVILNSDVFEHTSTDIVAPTQIQKISEIGLDEDGSPIILETSGCELPLATQGDATMETPVDRLKEFFSVLDHGRTNYQMPSAEHYLAQIAACLEKHGTQTPDGKTILPLTKKELDIVIKELEAKAGDMQWFAKLRDKFSQMYTPEDTPQVVIPEQTSVAVSEPQIETTTSAMASEQNNEETKIELVSDQNTSSATPSGMWAGVDGKSSCLGPKKFPLEVPSLEQLEFIKTLIHRRHLNRNAQYNFLSTYEPKETEK